MSSITTMNSKGVLKKVLDRIKTRDIQKEWSIDVVVIAIIINIQ